MGVGVSLEEPILCVTCGEVRPLRAFLVIKRPGWRRASCSPCRSAFNAAGQPVAVERRTCERCGEERDGAAFLDWPQGAAYRPGSLPGVSGSCYPCRSSARTAAQREAAREARNKRRRDARAAREGPKVRGRAFVLSAADFLAVLRGAGHGLTLAEVRRAAGAMAGGKAPGAETVRRRAAEGLRAGAVTREPIDPGNEAAGWRYRLAEGW